MRNVRHPELFDEDVFPRFDPTVARYLDHSQKDLRDRRPKNYHRPDERIFEDACEMLLRHPGVDASEIEVIVKDGRIRVQGMVPTRRMKYLVEDLLEEVWGIDELENGLRVNPRAFPYTETD